MSTTIALLEETRARAGALALALGWPVSGQEVTALENWARDWRRKNPAPAPAMPAPAIPPGPPPPAGPPMFTPEMFRAPPAAPASWPPSAIGTVEELRIFMEHHGIARNSWRLVTSSPMQWSLTVPAHEAPRIKRELSRLEAAGHVGPMISLTHFPNTNPCDICKRSHFTQDHKDNE